MFDLSNMQIHRIFTVARKAFVSFLGVLFTGLSMDVIPEPWDKLSLAVILVATYYGVYRIPNRENLPKLPKSDTLR
jgi:hypothetical protein